jgi:hypothetical protein
MSSRTIRRIPAKGRPLPQDAEVGCLTKLSSRPERRDLRYPSVRSGCHLHTGRSRSTTIMEGGTAVRLHASLCVAVNSKPGIGSPRLVPPALRMVRSQPQPVLCRNRVWVLEARDAAILMNPNSHPLQVLAPRHDCALGERPRAHVRAAGNNPGSARSPVDCHLLISRTLRATEIPMILLLSHPAGKFTY